MTAQFGSGLSDRGLAAIARARRAAAAERVATMNVTVELRPLASLGNVVEPWTALATRALEPNVFLDPAFALAAAPALGSDVKAGLVWSQGASPELLGLFPVRIASRRYGLPLPVLCAWTHPFGPLGTPLVQRDAAETAISAWLDHLMHDGSMPSLLLMPYMRDDGTFAAIFDGVLARLGSATARFDRHERAMLAPNGGRSDYLTRAIATKQRKELARKWRRMQELGAIAVSRAHDPDDIPDALDDFFRLEAAGWKGRAGTAAAAKPALRQFVTHAVTNLARRERPAIYRLSVAHKPIAACIILRSGQSAWCWKITYDEAYARFSPGAQLLVRVTEDLLHDAAITSADSLATPNHPLIDHIWRERCTLSDRLIAVRPDTLVPFSVVCRLEAMRRLGRAAARTIREHLRAG